MEDKRIKGYQDVTREDGGWNKRICLFLQHVNYIPILWSINVYKHVIQDIHSLSFKS